MVHSDKNNKRTKRFICKFLVFFALLVKKGNVNCTEAPKEAYSCKCTNLKRLLIAGCNLSVKYIHVVTCNFSLVNAFQNNASIL